MRKEYMVRNSSHQETERKRLDRKVRIREALEKGTPISQRDLLEEAQENEFGVTNVNNTAEEEQAEQKQKIQAMLDNEYALAGLEEPKIVFMGSRETSDRVKRFLKELKLLFPNAQRLNRGTQNIKEIVDICIQNGFTDICMVHESNGEPTSLVISHLPYGPTASFTLYNCVMQHDTDLGVKVSTAYPHLIFHNFKTKLGERVATILKYLFPIPKSTSKRIVTFGNDNDFISFRHHIYKKIDGKVHLKEVGPRFEMQLYEIRLGTLDQKDAQIEWVLRPYMNTAKKRQALGHSKQELLQEEEEKLNQVRE